MLFSAHPNILIEPENTHCVLAAHNGLVKAKLFTDLDKLGSGRSVHSGCLKRDIHV